MSSSRVTSATCLSVFADELLPFGPGQLTDCLSTQSSPTIDRSTLRRPEKPLQASTSKGIFQSQTLMPCPQTLLAGFHFYPHSEMKPQSSPKTSLLLNPRAPFNLHLLSECLITHITLGSSLTSAAMSAQPLLKALTLLT